MVTFFLGLAEGMPKGECELCLTYCSDGTKGRAASRSGRVLRTRGAYDRTRAEVEGMDILRDTQRTRMWVKVTF